MTSLRNALNAENVRNLFILAAFLLIAACADAPSGSEFLELVRDGDLESVRTALGRNPELVDVHDEDGRTPLHWACRDDLGEVVELLLASGADVNARDAFVNTPLHSLAYRDLAETMQTLIEHGAEIDGKNHEQMTPLHLAATAGSVAAMRVLIAAGTDLEATNDLGRTALILCARERGDARTARALLDAGANVDTVDASGNSALDLAAWRGKTELVGLLLDAGASIPGDPEKRLFLLSESATNGLARLFASVVAAGAYFGGPLANGGTLMHEAAAGGSLEIVETLVARGLEINHRDNYGWTPLHYAARDGRMPCATWLIENGAATDIRNIAGETPFNVAESMKTTEVMEMLREAGTDTSPAQFPDLRGPYMGQKPPGDDPEIFAPGIVSSIWSLHSAVTFSPEGDLAMWAPMVTIPGEIYSQGGVLVSRRIDDRWTAPRWAEFTGEVDGDVPFIAPDGRRVFFISTRPLSDPSEPGVERIWFTERNRSGWTQARAVDPAVNDLPQHWQFSVDATNALYFNLDIPSGNGGSDIYSSQTSDGRWQQPVNIGTPVNTPSDEATPFIAPDASYLVFQREGDLLVSLRHHGDVWGPPTRLGEAINTADRELCPIVSPDEKYLFFLRYRDGMTHVWWVSTASFLGSDQTDSAELESGAAAGKDTDS